MESQQKLTYLSFDEQEQDQSTGEDSLDSLFEVDCLDRLACPAEANRVGILIEHKKQELLQNKITYNQNFLQPELNIVLIDQTKTSRVLKFAVSFSHFIMEIVAVNFSECSRSRLCSLPILGEGSFSSIYLYDDRQNGSFAVKSINYSSGNLRDDDPKKREGQLKTLKNSIFQYCLYKLFSVLQVGPRLGMNFGFDLLIFSNAIEFPIEVCQPTHLESIDDLLTSLNLMHLHHIVHGDVKPQNIMWSPYFNKNVFVDFGLSKVVKENIGQKSLTHYFGTYQFSCYEMRLLLTQAQMGFVDLYFNDMFGFNLARKREAQKRNTADYDQKNYQNRKDYQEFVKNLKLCQILYRKCLSDLELLLGKSRVFTLLQDFTNILLDLEPDSDLLVLTQRISNQGMMPKQLQTCLSSYFKSTQGYSHINEKLKHEFDQRVKQISTQFRGSITDLMLFALVYLAEDVTPRALNKSYVLQKSIESYPAAELAKKDSHFWNHLVYFSKNCYVTASGLDTVFEMVRDKLGIKSWQAEYMENLKIFAKARQLAELAFLKCGVNLFEIYEESHSKKYQNIPIEVCKNFSPQFPYFQFLDTILKKCQNEKQKPKFLSEIRKCSVIKAYEQSLVDIIVKYNIKDVPYAVQLIAQSIKISSHDNQFINEAQIQEYLGNFRNFAPIQKIQGIYEYKEALNDYRKLRRNPFEYLPEEKYFLQGKSTFCYDLGFHLRVFFYEKIFSRIDYLQVDLEHVQRSFNEITEFVLRFCTRTKTLKALTVPLYELNRIFCHYFPACVAVAVSQMTHEVLVRLFSHFSLEACSEATLYVGMLVSELCVSTNEQTRNYLPELLLAMERRLRRPNQLLEVGYFNVQYTILKKYNMLAVGDDEAYLLHKIRIVERLDKPQFIFRNNFGIKLMSQYIMLCTSRGRRPDREVKVMLRSILNDENRFQNLEEYPLILCALAQYYATAQTALFNDYFCTLMDYLMRASDHVGTAREFILYCSALVLLEMCFSMAHDKRYFADQLYDLLVGVHRRSRQELGLGCPNVIIIFTFLIKERFLSNLEGVTAQFVTIILAMCMSVIGYSNYFFRADFLRSMDVWAAELAQQSLITNLSRRKNRLLRLKALRNKQFRIGKQSETHYDLLATSCKHGSGRCKAREGVRGKLQDMRQNRAQTAAWLLSSDLGLYFGNIYSAYISRQRPEKLVASSTQLLYM